jgi:hypothetical protein
MSHITCMRKNQGDSWLLMVESQIANLTPDPSFGYNLCFRCSNGSCEPISNIYILIIFQWYKKFLKLMGFNPSPSEDSGVHWDSNSQNGSSLGSVRVHSLTLSYIPRSMRCDFRVSLLARNLASPCLGREPKARVVTKTIELMFSSGE